MNIKISKIWIKENWFKLAIIFCLLLTILSFLYYYILFIPKIQKEKILALDLCLQKVNLSYNEFTDEITKKVNLSPEEWSDKRIENILNQAKEFKQESRDECFKKYKQ